MRQLFLVVILVAASFFGGAFVNGPGLQWAQTRVLRSLGLNQGGEIASVELKPMATSESDPQVDSAASIPPKPTLDAPQGLVAQVPSLQTKNKAAKEDVSDQIGNAPRQTKLIAGRLTSPSFQPTSSSPTNRSLPLGAPSDRTPSQLDTTVTPAGGIPRDDSPRTSSRSSTDSAPAILDSLAALLPVDPPSSTQPSPPLPSQVSAAKVLVNQTDSWKTLERKMRSMGVIRYTIDGDLGGRVVFSCLIPLAGRQAVAQRFEADGDDIIQATEAALRRIALFRATQPSLP